MILKSQKCSSTFKMENVINLWWSKKKFKKDKPLEKNKMNSPQFSVPKRLLGNASSTSIMLRCCTYFKSLFNNKAWRKSKNLWGFIARYMQTTARCIRMESYKQWHNYSLCFIPCTQALSAKVRRSFKCVHGFGHWAWSGILNI